MPQVYTKIKTSWHYQHIFKATKYATSRELFPRLFSKPESSHPFWGGRGKQILQNSTSSWSPNKRAAWGKKKTQKEKKNLPVCQSTRNKTIVRNLCSRENQRNIRRQRGEGKEEGEGKKSGENILEAPGDEKEKAKQGEDHERLCESLVLLPKTQREARFWLLLIAEGEEAPRRCRAKLGS
jgi:hypothetical protein